MASPRVQHTLAREPRPTSAAGTSIHEVKPPYLLASSSSRFARIKAICDQVAGADVPVLILGETGVGKEVLARYLHAKSGRSGPFIRVNCAALPSELMESELFGYERGAFTGALTGQPGKFALAAGGTILLDEIAEMHPVLQAKLLHVLQDGEYMRLGGRQTLVSDARIIAATNLNIEAAVASARFREDLLFRLNVITLDVPPLRERPEDIAALCHYFTARYSAAYQSPIKELPQSLLDAYRRYHWPGNVRQLENAIRRFLILRDPLAAIAEVASVPAPLTPQPQAVAPLRQLSALAAEKAEKELIIRTLNDVNWNRKQAAMRLDMCYKSLLNKLRKWHLNEKAPLRE